jgi:hypothetical protein
MTPLTRASRPTRYFLRNRTFSMAWPQDDTLAPVQIESPTQAHPPTQHDLDSPPQPVDDEASSVDTRPTSPPAQEVTDEELSVTPLHEQSGMARAADTSAPTVQSHRFDWKVRPLRLHAYRSAESRQVSTTRARHQQHGAKTSVLASPRTALAPVTRPSIIRHHNQPGPLPPPPPSPLKDSPLLPHEGMLLHPSEEPAPESSRGAARRHVIIAPHPSSLDRTPVREPRTMQPSVGIVRLRLNECKWLTTAASFATMNDRRIACCSPPTREARRAARMEREAERARLWERAEYGVIAAEGSLTAPPSPPPPPPPPPPPKPPLPPPKPPRTAAQKRAAKKANRKANKRERQSTKEAELETLVMLCSLYGSSAK